MKVEVSNGEILDKLSILEIKLEKIKDENKLKNIQGEYNILKNTSKEIVFDTNIYEKLLNVNNRLWNIEDKLREKERKKEFDTEFIELARSVYFTNDERADIKRKINIETKSKLIEEKSYKKY